MFPKLSTACLEEIFKKLEWDDMRLEIYGEYLNNLRFVDDTVFAKEFREGIRENDQ